jgi:hypothetical protein
MKRVLQYVSDIHVDYLHHSKLPRLKALSPHLLICGDIGNPKHPNFSTFLKNIKSDFDKIYFVPGNHEYDTSSCFSSTKAVEFKSFLYENLDKYNINLLDCSHYEIDKDTVIGGCTLWSNPSKNLYNISKERYNEHIMLHRFEKDWLSAFINKYSNKKIIIGTHFVHTPKLIEKKYYINNEPSDWFHTNLEEMIKSPVIGWFCGHTHSNIEININDVICGVNYGFKEKTFIY